MNATIPATSRIMDASLSSLVLIDFQPRLMAALAGADLVLKNARRLAKAAGLLGVPVYATEQNPEKLGPGDPELSGLADETFTKMCFGAAATGLGGRLRAHDPAERAAGRPSLVIAGCEAHICLLQTALQFKADGRDVFVVGDACGSRTEMSRQAAMDRLAAAGCEIATTEMVLFEWLATAEHPRFKAIQALIK